MNLNSLLSQVSSMAGWCSLNASTGTNILFKHYINIKETTPRLLDRHLQVDIDMKVTHCKILVCYKFQHLVYIKICCDNLIGSSSSVINVQKKYSDLKEQLLADLCHQLHAILIFVLKKLVVKYMHQVIYLVFAVLLIVLDMFWDITCIYPPPPPPPPPLP